jgi:hypothetical protein
MNPQIPLMKNSFGVSGNHPNAEVWFYAWEECLWHNPVVGNTELSTTETD